MTLLGRIGRVFRVFVIFVVVLGGVSAGGLFAWGRLVWTEDGPDARDGDETLVVLERGAALKQIARTLKSDGVISNSMVFEAALRLAGRDAHLKAGEYAIPSGASMEDVAELILSGKALLYKFTAPEGLTSKQIVRLVQQNEVLVGDVTLNPAEGTLLPQTYMFQRGESRDEMISHMANAMNEALVSLWNERADGLPFDSMEEAVTLASIVEKETAVPEERPRIAAVFVNRLNRGMRLQSDPTIIYGLTGGEPLGRGIRRSELDRKTLYNTYHIDGLPPTPIANPGIESLEAVLNPPQTNELFFVADGTGGHAFASTNREHQQNVATWRKVERERQKK